MNETKTTKKLAEEKNMVLQSMFYWEEKVKFNERIIKLNDRLEQELREHNKTLKSYKVLLNEIKEQDTQEMMFKKTLFSMSENQKVHI